MSLWKYEKSLSVFAWMNDQVAPKQIISPMQLRNRISQRKEKCQGKRNPAVIAASDMLVLQMP